MYVNVDPSEVSGLHMDYGFFMLIALAAGRLGCPGRDIRSLCICPFTDRVTGQSSWKYRHFFRFNACHERPFAPGVLVRPLGY